MAPLTEIFTQPIILALSFLYTAQIAVLILGRRWASGPTSFFLYYLFGSLLGLAAFYAGLAASPTLLG